MILFLKNNFKEKLLLSIILTSLNCSINHSKDIKIDTSGYLEIFTEDFDGSNEFTTSFISANDGINNNVEKLRNLVIKYKEKVNKENNGSQYIWKRYNLVITKVKSNNHKVDCDEDYFRTPLMWACLSGEPEDLLAVLYLIKEGVDLNKQRKLGTSNKYFLDSALHYAVYRNHLVFVEVLSKQPGIKIDIKNADGNTPLLIACNRCNYFIIKTLISNGADINLKKKNQEGVQEGVIELSMMGYFNFFQKKYPNRMKMAEDSINYLLDNKKLKINQELLDKYLFLAYFNRCGIKIIKKLRAKGATYKYVDKSGDTIFHCLIKLRLYNNEDEKLLTAVHVMRVLQDSDLYKPINEFNKQKITPIYESILYKRWRICILLLKYGADINIACENNFAYPIHLLARENYNDVSCILELAMKKGLILDSKNKNQVTGFTWAVSHRNDEMTDWFLQNGTDTDTSSKNGNNIYIMLLLQVILNLLKSYLKIVSMLIQ